MSPLSATGELVINRTFEAPRDLVWKAWIQPEHFARWFGPRGSSMPSCRMEARPGGEIFFCHHFEGGLAAFGGEKDIWIQGRYLEVVRPERLVFSIYFSDKDGHVVERAGFSRESRVEVTFREKGRQTEVAIRQTGLKADQGESEGWKQGLDRLEELLKSREGES